MAAERNPVVLLPGIDNTCAMFDCLQTYLETQSFAVHCVNLTPNNGAQGLELLARQLAGHVERVFSRSESVDLVAFSMGGLVARYYVQRLGGADRVRRLITIAAPHHGSWMAYLRGNKGARQMRPGSRFLRELNADMRVFERVALTSIWSPLDLMIVPANSSVIAQARMIRVLVPAHPQMVRARRVFELLRAALVAL